MGSSIKCAMYNFIEMKDRIWFWAFQENCLCNASKDFDTVSVELCVMDNYDNRSVFGEYGNIVGYQNKIVVIPEARANDILVFDTENKTVKHIDYPRDCYEGGKVFAEGIVFGEELFLIPSQYNGILVINMSTYSVDRILIDGKSGGCGYAWGSVYTNCENVFFSSLCNNMIYKFNMRDKKLEAYVCAPINMGSGVVGNKEDLWVISKNSAQIVRCDKEMRVKEMIDSFPDGFEPGDWSFAFLKKVEDKVFFLPRSANMGLVLDLNSQLIEQISFEHENENVSQALLRYMPISNVWKHNDKLFYSSTTSGELIEMDYGRLNIEVQEMPAVVDGRLGVVNESDTLGLNTFIDSI